MAFHLIRLLLHAGRAQLLVVFVIHPVTRVDNRGLVDQKKPTQRDKVLREGYKNSVVEPNITLSLVLWPALKVVETCYYLVLPG